MLSPRVDRRSDVVDRYSRLADRHAAELREGLQQQDVPSRAHCPYDKVARPRRLRERSRNGGVDQDVGIEADHHRSCISSRVKARKAAPQGRPWAITAIA